MLARHPGSKARPHPDGENIDWTTRAVMAWIDDELVV
jgi:hypothetical protein